MNVIWALISLAAITWLLPAVKPSSETTKINLPGFILLAIGTVSLQLFLDRGQHNNWFDSELILGLLMVVVVAFALYLAVTFIMKDGSVLDLSLLRDIPFSAGNLANMLLMGSIYGALVVKIIYFQLLMGFTPVQSGNYPVVFSGAMLVFSVVAGILTDKINPRWPVIK